MSKKMMTLLPSLIISGFGLAVMLGWGMHAQLFSEWGFQYIPVFNSGFLFTLSGVALGCCFYSNPLTERIQIGLGAVILIFAGIVFYQDLIHSDLGIDQLFVGASPNYFFPHPGRLTPNSAISFMLMGLTFVLLPWAHIKKMALAIEAVIFFIFFISSIAIAGYLLKIEFLYSWYHFNNMPLAEGLAFAFSSAVIWGVWHENPYATLLYQQGREDKKIFLICVLIFLFIGTVIGAACFINLSSQQIDFVKRGFQEKLRNNAESFQTQIQLATSTFNSINASLPLFVPHIGKNNMTLSPSEMTSVEKFYLAQGFSAVNILNEQGKLMAQEGTFIANPEMSVKLNAAVDTTLVWQNGWYIRMSQHAQLSNQQKIFLTAEWPMRGIDNLFASAERQYNTSAIVLCSLIENKQVLCFPFRNHPQIIRQSLSKINPNGPMTHALKGDQGAMITYDQHHIHILAAYQAIDHYNLYIFFKVNVAELYKQITQKIYVVAAIVLMGVIIGLLLLRMEITPLLYRVVRAEKKLRKRNRQLKESEERYRLAMTGSGAGLWDWEVGTDRIFYSNYLKHMLGYTDDELKNSIQELEKNIHPEDAERASQALRDHILHHQPYKIEYRLRHKSGDYYWFQAVGQAVWDKRGYATRMAGSLLDISRQKLNEKTQITEFAVTQIISQAVDLRIAIPDILRVICENLDWDFATIWIVDEKTQRIRNLDLWYRPDLAVKQLEAVTRNLELEKGKSLPGMVWLHAKPYWNVDFKNQNDDAVFVRKQQAIEGGLNAVFCYPILLQNKVFGVIEFFSERAFLLTDEKIQLITIFAPQIGQFIQRKFYENDLRASEAQKTAILNSASDSIITVNEKGMIVSFNSRTMKMFGYFAKDLHQAKIQILIPGLTEKLKEIVGKGPIEFIASTKPGTCFPVELTVSGMNAGHQVTYVVIVRDVAERKKVEKLKSEFVSVVSHELRTPLTSIRGSISLLLGGVVGDLSEKAKKLLEIANNNCERLLHLINDILDVEKIEAGKMTFHCEPHEIVKLVIDSITANQMYGEKFAVRIQLTESIEPTWVSVDVDRFIQVMTNLISNAVKFSPQGGTVDVAIKFINERVRVAVKDQGPGIPDTFKGEIFQRFSQADTKDNRKHGGTGLGLNICKSIIEKLGGTLKFVSQKNEGCTFYFDLKTVAHPVLTGVKTKNESVNIQSGTLLLCEDDESQALYLKALLEEAGYTIDLAGSAEEVKKLVSMNEYKALLLDLILPDQDGIALIRELRLAEKTKLLPIIVTSVISQTGESILNGDAFSVIDWLDKPIDFNKLVILIQRLNKKAITSERPHILHVEDDLDEQQMVKTLLQETVDLTFVTSLHEAKIKLIRGHYDLVILDLVCADGNATELLPLLAKTQTPVIVYSASELDEKYASFVHEALVKSKMSQQKLLETIKNILAMAAS